MVGWLISLPVKAIRTARGDHRSPQAEFASKHSKQDTGSKSSPSAIPGKNYNSDADQQNKLCPIWRPFRHPLKEPFFLQVPNRLCHYGTHPHLPATVALSSATVALRPCRPTTASVASSCLAASERHVRFVDATLAQPCGPVERARITNPRWAQSHAMHSIMLDPRFEQW